MSFRIRLGDYVRFNSMAGPSSNTLVIISIDGSVWLALVEALIARAFQINGYKVVVISGLHNLLSRMYFRLFGIQTIFIYERFLSPNDLAEVKTRATAMMAEVSSVDRLVNMRYKGVAIGKAVASRTIRVLRGWQLDLSEPETRQVVAELMLDSVRGLVIAERLAQEFGVAGAVLACEKFYTPWRELFDTFILAGWEGFVWNVQSGMPDSIVFRRYRPGDNLTSLEMAWQSVNASTLSQLEDLTWTPVLEQFVLDTVRTHFHAPNDLSPTFGVLHNGKEIFSPAEIRRLLGFDSRKKVAAVFPSVSWDGALCFGHHIFNGYGEWLLETIRVAINVPEVDWIIRLHPANRTMAVWDGVRAEQDKLVNADQIEIQRCFGSLPAHIKIIPPDSRINTYSLFSIADTCLTVSGTIGVEMPCFGIPVVVAGFQRYSGLGFTYDCQTKDEYFARLRALRTLPRLSREQQIQAQKHALCFFWLRTFRLRSIHMDYRRNMLTPDVFYLPPQVAKSLDNAEDVKAFAKWALNSDSIDYVDWTSLADILNSLEAHPHEIVDKNPEFVLGKNAMV